MTAAAETAESTQQRRACLVIGGCGFIGYHLVARLLRDQDWQPVYVLDRNTAVNRHEKARYVQGDATDETALARLLDEARPSVVFHAASPTASLPARRRGEFVRTNIEGTRAVLAGASKSDAVEALVYTSSVDAYARPPHDNIAEDHPLWPDTDTSNEYNRTKAVADVLVRAANGPSLRTTCLRLSHVYGERQSQGLVEMLEACEGNRPLVQIGSGENRMDVVTAANAAEAHVLAARALLREARSAGDEPPGEDSCVGGQAFNINDGAPVPFWHHVSIVWVVVRGPEALRSVVVVPGWIMVAVVTLLEWLLWVLTLDTVRPPTALGRTSLHYCLYSHTYTIEKARRRLGYDPASDHDADMARAVEYLLQQRAESQKAA